MSHVNLIRSEVRKLTSTKMPWMFLLVLAVIAVINASAVIWGTDFDGSKGFVSTAADQQSLVAFASNAIHGATSSEHILGITRLVSDGLATRS